MEKKFKDMTSQELFEASVRGLFKQGRRCGNDSGCFYRGESYSSHSDELKGLKCGVGMVISDEDYRETMEGYSVYQLCDYVLSDSEVALYLRRNQYILSAIQSIHDTEENWVSEETLKEKFIGLTQTFTSLDGSFIEGLKLERPENART